MSRDHRKLRAFVLADALVIDAYQLTRDFPKDEWYGLRGQMRRAALSTACNIVEGAARTSLNEYLNFLNVAFGSLRELGYCLTVAERLGYFDEPSAMKLKAQQSETARVLSALIRSLRVRRNL